MKRTALHGGVQDLLPLDDIADAVLCLRGGEYRAVLQAQSVNFALKSEDEQEAVLAGYRSFLNSLRHPLQMLVRILPTDVEPYLAGFANTNTTQAGSEAMRRLALNHETFVRRLARERTLLERRFYVVVPAGETAAFATDAIRWPWKRNRPPADQQIAVARAQLTARCQEIAQGLAAFGVPSRRLGSGELAELWAACLCACLSQPSPSLSAGRRPVVAAGQRGALRHA